MRKKSTRKQRVLSLLLALVLVFGLMPMGLGAGALTEGEETQSLETLLSEEQLEAYAVVARSSRMGGLTGFADEWALEELDDDETVSVIVEFIHQPAAIQQLEAIAEGESISLDEAEKLAEADHVEFVQEMNALFGTNARAYSSSASDGYEIVAEYEVALNGVAVNLPAGRLEELAELDTVFAVYPNTFIPREDETYTVDADGDGDAEQLGMADTREYLGIDALHDAGLTGEGVTVAILDTGVDYNHPDLVDAFADSLPDGASADSDLEPLEDGKYYGRNLVDYEPFIGTSNYIDLPERDPFDPMETTYAEYLESDYSESVAWDDFVTAHGTHVSGTVAGRGVNTPISALGMAPDANLLMYRVLGPYGGYSSWVISGIELAVVDGCDVVNMSLGASVNNPQYATSLAVNNVMLANENIVFAISAGNDGPGAETLGSPGTSSLAITVGNGTVDSVDYEMTAMADSEGAFIRLLTSDFDTYFTADDEGNATLVYDDLEEMELVVIPDVNSYSGVEVNGEAVGYGSTAEFEAVKDEVAGKIAVVSRGQTFVSTAAIAKQYGAGAVIVITNQTGSFYNFQGDSVAYAPVFLSESMTDAIAMVEDAINHNDSRITFADYQETELAGGELNESSSRGPTGTTHAIGVDVVAPGTTVLSSVPYYITSTGDKSDYTEAGAYDYAYERYTGTSMSAPHIAGIAALMKQYSRDQGEEWTALEIKARMMNTADPMEGYSVSEVGGGYVNPAAALEADAYAVAEYGQVYTGAEIESGYMGSLNFSPLYIEYSGAQEETITSTVYNLSDTDKTYTITQTYNYTGFGMAGTEYLVANEQQWDTSGITLAPSVNSVTVPAGGTAEFDMSVSIPADRTLEDSALYEGYLVLENDDDPQDVIRLPYAARVTPESLIGEAFLNQPVITTSDYAHTDYSFYADLYLSLNTQSEGLTFGITRAGEGDPLDMDDWIGESVYQASTADMTLGELYHLPNTVIPYYYDYTSPSGLDIAVFEPGHYKLVLALYTGATWVVTDEVLDLYVDNVPPELTIDGIDGAAVEYADTIHSATLTGTIYDEGVAYIMENGFTYDIYDSEDDYHSAEPDQALNAVFAKVGNSSTYVQAEVEADGSFTLDLTGLSSTGTTEVTLYYYDFFSAAQFPGDAEISTGFDPDNICMNEYYGGSYGFNGLNGAVETITLQYTGAMISIAADATYLEPGESTQLTAIINDEAAQAGYTITGWSTSNPSAATVDESGLVTAVDSGTTIITATADSGDLDTLTAVCTITVSGPGDGVELSADSLIWFGTTEHEDYDVTYNAPNGEDAISVSDDPFTYNGETELPMLWTVAGEEIRDGYSDGYITLAAAYSVYTDTMNADGSYSTYESWDILDDLNDTETGFLSGFTAGELAAVPQVDVEVPGGDAVVSQQVYLPWGDAQSNTVYWSAGGEAISENAFAYNWLDTRVNLNYTIDATYYLRNTVGEDTILVAEGLEDQVETRTSWDRFSTGVDLSSYGSWSAYSVGVGVRPIVKLDLNKIVYYHPYSEMNYATDRTDGFPFDMDSLYDYNYNSEDGGTGKLAVIGGNDGLDVGTLDGVPTEAQTIEAGHKLELSGVTSSEEGDDYIIAYKIVGDVNGQREILDYVEYDASTASQDITVYTGQLAPGQYKVYLWLQQQNSKSSYETGVVESFTLNVEETAGEDVSDGVTLQADSYVYLGEYAHATEATYSDSGTGDYLSATAWEDKATPILWQVMGEEVDAAGDGDGYLTLMSRYVLDAWQYSVSQGLLGGVPSYEDVAINLELNRSFVDSFTTGELNSIPQFTVDRIDYDIDDYMLGAATSSAENQQVYLPWGTIYYAEDDDQYASYMGSVRSIFWSAGDSTALENNALGYKYREVVDSEKIAKATLKNGDPASYWLSAASSMSNYVTSDGTFYEFDGWRIRTLTLQNTGGVRPVTKLDTTSIVYAAEIGEEIEADSVNYIAPGDGETYYKLTVLGGHGGKDVGELTGVPTSASVLAESDLTLTGILGTTVGPDYSIAYKIVGGEDGEREIVAYGELEDDTIGTADLALGSYDLYLWLQKNNDTTSHEAGVVYTVPLTVDVAGDKEELEEVYEQYKDLEQGDYTDESYVALQEALEEVERVLADDQATQADVDRALNALQDAIAGLTALEPVDKDDLQNLYDEYKALEQGDYTDESYAALQDALAEAASVLANDDASQADVDEALEALQTAIAGLEEKDEPEPVDKDELQALYDAYKDLEQGDYTDDSYDALQAALAEAASVLTNDDASQADVDEALEALQTAIAGLEEYTGGLLDVDDLQALYDEYKDLEQGDYTDESWAALQEALEEVERVLADENATQGDIDAAYEKLEEAIAGLTTGEEPGDTYTITGTANRGGSITESVEVEAGADAEMEIAADEGYVLVALLVDGVTVDLAGIEDGVYTIERVEADHELRALFIPDQEEDFAAKYTDVEADDWYYEAVDMLTGLGVVEGVEKDSYAPDKKITRAEFTKLMYELAGVLGVDTEEVDAVSFGDVTGHWAYGHIGWAQREELVEGYDEETFGPEDDMLRQDMAVFMKRFFDEHQGYDLPGERTKTFSDADEIEAYAEEAVEYAVRTGLMQGHLSGEFGPQETAQRSHVAQVIYNYLIYTD